MPVAHYPRYRFPPAIISHAVWLYYPFTLSFRDVEDLLAQCGITVSYESIRHWCETFGACRVRKIAFRPRGCTREAIRRVDHGGGRDRRRSVRA